MKVIGVTGGIATGKTTVAREFATHGAALFDADLCVHQLMEQHLGLIEEVEKKFPNAIESKKINREALGEEVFADENKLKQLEELLHPYVRDMEEAFIEHSKKQNRPFVILDIPLLFETGAEAICDVVVTTECSEDVQRQRAMQRPAMTKEKLDGILSRQMSQKERSERADFVIDTNGDAAHAAKQAKKVIKALGL